MSSTATTTVKTKQRSPSSASQKFWPLKKFGLHHGKTEEQQSIPLSLTTTKEPLTPVEPTKGNFSKKIFLIEHYFILIKISRYSY